MKNTLRLTASLLLTVLLLPLSSLAQDGRLIWSDRPEGNNDLNLVWESGLAETERPGQPAWANITSAGPNELPENIIHIKNVLADVDLDADGNREVVVPVFWDDAGTNRRSVFIFENTGDDQYDAVWSFDFDGVADQFVTVDQGDLDGDGALELLVIHIRAAGDNDEGPELYVFENQGDNDFGEAPAVTWDLNNSARDVVRLVKAADLDGDGKEEVVLPTFMTQPGLIIASVSDFAVPVWTIEYTDARSAAVDIAAAAIADADSDGNLEAWLTDGATDEVLVVEGAGADTYAASSAVVSIAGKSVSVHGMDAGDVNEDGQQEVYIANLQGAVWVAQSSDVATLVTEDIALIEDTEEQWLEASLGSLDGLRQSFVIAASNASKAEAYQYTGGAGGDVTSPDSWTRTEIVEEDDFTGVISGGMRVYGLDTAADLDGDGKAEVIFSRGSTRGGANAPALFILETESDFTPVAVEEVELPNGFKLHQNYPNPFNPETNIAFTLIRAGTVNLSIYNLLGQRVATLVRGYQAPQTYTVRWNGTDNSGARVPSGLYLYRLEVDGIARQKTMLLIK